MINNFELIKNFVEFQNNDDFFFVYILKRKRENPNIKRDSISIHNYYFSSIKDFDKYHDEIVDLCNDNNARCYINLNKRSFKEVALESNFKTAELLKNNQYRAVYKTYLSACGKNSNEKIKKWIIDLEKEDISHLENIKYMIESSGSVIYLQIPTKNGIHLVVKGFDSRKFRESFPTIEIKEDNPTILYSI